MKQILAILGDGPADPVLAAAWLVAKRFGGQITGLLGTGAEYAAAPAWQGGLSIYAALDPVVAGEREAQQAKAAAAFHRFLQALDVQFGAVPRRHKGVTAFWCGDNSRAPPAISTRSRLFDLIVMARPDRPTSSLAGITLEDTLFSSGRPVLVCPKRAPAQLGDSIAIAWNGSTESAQTVALAMPLLKRARRVIVIATGRSDMPEPGPSGTELGAALARHGINVHLRAAVGRQKRQGESFLREAQDADADLLLKGAYARSRLRQLVFGGATRQILLASPIPVLIAR
jgi:nucleotide-binding universal stress UspA family protein